MKDKLDHKEPRDGYLYSLSQVIELGFLGVTTKVTLRRMIHNKEIPAVNISRKEGFNMYRINGTEIKRYLSSRIVD